jgi:hypothetical protein
MLSTCSTLEPLASAASLSTLSGIGDADLLATTKRLAQHERAATAALVAALAELDARRLYLGEGCSSLFVYCTRVLCLSEHAAYHRIEAARAARRFPLILERLAAGSLTLTTVTLLAPHLTPANHQAVLDAAHHRSKRAVEQQVAALASRPDAPTSVRKLPQLRSAGMPPPGAAPSKAVSPSTPVNETMLSSQAHPALATHSRCASTADDAPMTAAAATTKESAAAARDMHTSESAAFDTPVIRTTRERTVMTPLAPARYKLQMTLGADTVEKLRRAQDLLRHTIPDGDPAAILDRALTFLLADVARTKLAATKRPRINHHEPHRRSRYVPAAVRRAVWMRDGGRCTFVGTEGQCGETGFLELHHLEPYALGGATTVKGMALRCRAHNAYEADREFRVLEHAARSTRGGQQLD